jgi:hypothetical protein
VARVASSLDKLDAYANTKNLRLGIDKDEGILEVVVWVGQGHPTEANERAREVVGAVDGINAAAQRVLDRLTRR